MSRAVSVPPEAVGHARRVWGREAEESTDCAHPRDPKTVQQARQPEQITVRAVTSAQPPTYRMNCCFSANKLLAPTAEPMGRVASAASQPKVSYLALPRRKARKAAQRLRLSPMSLQARLDAKSAWAPRDDVRQVPVSVYTRRRAACATRRRALARAAPSHPSSPLRSPNSRLIFPPPMTGFIS